MDEILVVYVTGSISAIYGLVVYVNVLSGRIERINEAFDLFLKAYTDDNPYFRQNALIKVYEKRFPESKRLPADMIENIKRKSFEGHKKSNKPIIYPVNDTKTNDLS